MLSGKNYLTSRIPPTLILILAFFTVDAQSYFANGDARAIGGDCYQLTGTSNFENGSVWYADQIDLDKDFDLEFYLSFGTRDADGADGIIFVLQTVSNTALGASGGGIGFEGFAPSLGIEFDTWQNFNYGDPYDDHIAILSNGSVDHLGSNSLSDPVSATSDQKNIEDGQDHLVRVTYDAKVKSLEVWFDCELRHSLSIDLRKSIFTDDNLVYWGFTSATGGSVNVQKACLKKDILVPKVKPICKGDTALLNVRQSQDGVYRWFPGEFLSDTTIKRPKCFTTVPKVYYAEFTDLCGNKVIDTVSVVIHQPFQMDEGHDTLLCDGERYRIRLKDRYDSALWNGGYRLLNRDLTDSGFYRLRAWKGVCYDDDSFYIKTNITPEILLSADSVFCADQTSLVELTVTPRDAEFEWDDGNRDTFRTFNSTTHIGVHSWNECGETTNSIFTRQIFMDSLTIIGDSLICDRDPITLTASLDSLIYIYDWSTGASTRQIVVSEEGDYTLEVRDKVCSVQSTKPVGSEESPVFDLPDDILLCEKEEIILHPNIANADIFWDETIADSFVLLDYDGRLEVRAMNACGEMSQTVEITLKECFCELLFPNAITTNGDNLNEVFRPFVECDKLSSYELMIYNRWGEKLMTTNDINSADIAEKLDELQLGVYAWICLFSGVEAGRKVNKMDSGVVHVIH